MSNWSPMAENSLTDEIRKSTASETTAHNEYIK